jgi:hypothetical protein
MYKDQLSQVIVALLTLKLESESEQTRSEFIEAALTMGGVGY